MSNHSKTYASVREEKAAKAARRAARDKTRDAQDVLAGRPARKTKEKKPKYIPRVSVKRASRMKKEAASRKLTDEIVSREPILSMIAPLDGSVLSRRLRDSFPVPRPIEKHGSVESRTYLDILSRLPCSFCGKGPWPEKEKKQHVIDPHHVLVRGTRGERYDLTAVPACRGPATTNCHDLAQTGRISIGVQYRALGELHCRLPRMLVKSQHSKVFDEMRTSVAW